VEGNVAFDLLHNLVDVSVEHGYRSEALQIGECLGTVLGARTPLRIDDPQRNVGKDHDGTIAVRISIRYLCLSAKRTQTKENYLRLVGCLLLLSGFSLVLAALVMLPAFASRAGFAVAGFGVEVLGLGLLIQGYKSAQKEQR
jgi:hypothetical protein